jgi:hypothetical protein
MNSIGSFNTDVTKLNLKVEDSVVDLSRFSGLNNLCKLSLSCVEGREGKPQLLDFQCKLPALTSLSITDAFITASFFELLPELKLRKLTLLHCDFDHNCTVKRLLHVKEKVNLIGAYVHGGGNATRNFLYKVRELTRLEIPIRFEVKPEVIDRTDFSTLLTSRKELHRYSYPLQELEHKRWTMLQMDRLLYVEADDEDTNRKAVDGSALENKTCALEEGSPIRCPDRLRILAPECKIWADNWRFALKENVTVFAMLKAQDVFIYFSGRFGNIDVRPIKKENRGFGITQRTLEVSVVGSTDAPKIVHHLQIDWDDGQPIEIERLVAYIDMLCELEANNPGASIYHCSASRGRSGVVLAAVLTKWAIEQQCQDLDETALNLENLIRALRQWRQGLIANGKQLAMIPEYASVIYRRKVLGQ